MKNFYVTIIVFIYSIFGFAQVTTPTGTSQEVGITEGQLSVSLSGAATYSIPIAMPPGINGVVPQIGLVYNSQGGNGMAGYGWNISGVSAITRIPRTKFHDGVVGGVNLDANDRFALDGQRLIVKNNGVYGATNSEYETENFSNLKITSIGVSPLGANFGPATFKVEYPDGSVAYYGNDNGSRSITTWGITYWENPQGVRISYSYTLANNNLSIEYIKYGSIGTNTTINQIQFVYKTRQRPEQSYIGGQSIIMDKILSEIKVFGNSLSFRNYILAHDTTSLGYERLVNITEKSGNGTKSYNPTVFNYQEPIVTEQTTFVNSIDLPLNSGYDTTTGDFDGDGNLDSIIKSKIYTNLNADESQLDSFDSNPVVGSPWGTSAFKSLENDGKIMKRDAICQFSYTLPTNQDGTIKGVKYGLYSKESNALKFEYSKEFDFEVLPHNHYMGDFNGDGLSDSMLFPAMVKDVHLSKVIFLNLDRRISTNFSTQSNFEVLAPQYFEAPYPYNTYMKNSVTLPADVNGDGKTDLVVFRGVPYNKITVYSLDDNDNITILFETNYVFKKYLDLVSSSGLAAIDATNLLSADLNGDGKMDFFFPGIDRVVFMSTGKSFVSEAISNTIGYSPLGANFFAGDYNNDGKTDIIGVVKNFNNTTPVPLRILIYSRISSSNWTAAISNYDTILNEKEDLLNAFMIKPSKNFNDKPELLLLHWNSYNKTTKIHFFVNQNNLAKQTLLKSITTGNGVKETITYSPLMNGNGVYTAAESIENYPNIDLSNASGFQVVSKIEKQSTSVYKKQLFAYYGAVFNVEGRGFLGFRSTVKTNWHDDSNPIISTISKFDIDQRGANIENYTVLGWHDPLTSTGNYKPENILKEGAYTITGSENLVATQRIVLKPNSWIKGGSTFAAKITPDANVSPNTPTDYITKSLLTYESELSPNKVFKIKNVLSKQYNALENTNSETSTIYDVYNNPKQITTQIKEGTTIVQTTITTLGYDDQPYGARYYIGRPTSKTQNLTVTGDATTSDEVYVYTNHLLTKVKKKANNSDFIIEDNEYDTYGNITKKTITAPAIAPNPAPAPRVTNYEYNPASPYNGRFLTKSTDIQGLATQFNYNPSSGVLNSVTNPYNLTTSYLYDSWFKKSQTTDYLGKKNIYQYFQLGVFTVVTTTGDDGSFSSERFDDIGRKIQTYAYGINGNVDAREVVYSYDIYDRKVKVFEPNNLNQWSETKYDEYGRIEENKLYTGKTLTMSYSGLSSTVNDGTKTKTYTKNAMGNVVSLKEDTATTSQTINYTYFANGNLKTTNYDSVVTTIEQDDWGRKTKLIDPSAGEYRYAYNGFGETTSETTPNGTTTYNLDNFGRLSTKTISGTNTNSKTTYNYDSTLKLLNSSVFEDLQAGTTTSYTYLYDSSKRLYKTVEATPSYATFTKQFTFDTFGRVENETSIASVNGKTSSKTIKNTYKNGYPWQILSDDATPKVLWQTNTVNARGQLLTAQLGNGIAITNAYDDYGYFTQFKHDKTGTNPANIMTLNTTFDPVKGNLKTRTNSMFLWSEDFTNSYDSQDRLTSYKNAQGQIEQQLYDDKGKITENSLGFYNYTQKAYQNSSIELTPEAKTYYTAKPLQDISYNVFKSPVEIIENDANRIPIEKVSFTYNDNNDRSMMYYGGAGLANTRQFRKHYSADGTMEIKEDRTLGTTEFITYISGDAYSAPIVVKSNGVTQNYLYLHRDYLGSIVAITDANAVVLEKRLFDAWGSLISIQNGSSQPIANSQWLIDRGYTAHEHLQSVGLINMNGRIYDPKLHRFLQPDNYIQDPFDTQNYNRYSYVLNNPLKYTDPDGESILGFIAGVLFTSYANGVNSSGGEYNPTKWDSTTWTNVGLGVASIGASTVATYYTNDYITNYNKPPAIVATAPSGGGGNNQPNGVYERGEDGKWVKVSVVGDISGIDFYNTNHKDNDGFQLTFATDRKGNWAKIRKGREVLSGQLRGNDVNWRTIYNEWNTDTGPERSVFEGKHPANFAIKDNYLYGRAHSKFIDSGQSKYPAKANFYYGWDNFRTFNNMQVQMMGTYNVSFYKLGNYVLNIVQDSKSRSSFYYHAPVQNYKRGQGYIGENGMWYPPIQGENNTYQTYIFMTDK